MKTFLLGTPKASGRHPGTMIAQLGFGVMGELLAAFTVTSLPRRVDFHEAQPPLQAMSKAGQTPGRPKRRTGHNPRAAPLQTRKKGDGITLF